MRMEHSLMSNRLLSHPRMNAKTAKSSVPIYTLGLSPHRTASDVTVCPSSTPGCRSVCLHYQGRSRVYTGILKGRKLKTQRFIENEEEFLRRLAKDLLRLKRGTAVRLNTFSDIEWTTPERSWIFKVRGDLQFFDYTKRQELMEKYFYDPSWPKNYYLTFSRAENNEEYCYHALSCGGCVTVVYDGPLVSKWKEIPVIDGDFDDARFKDPPGHWVALKFKGSDRQKEFALRAGFCVRFDP